MITSPLRLCAACNRNFLAYVGRPGESYYCPKCAKAKQAAWNPKRNDIVKICDDTTTTYVVLERTGDMLTVRILGRPDTRSFPVHVNNTTWR